MISFLPKFNYHLIINYSGENRKSVAEEHSPSRAAYRQPAPHLRPERRAGVRQVPQAQRNPLSLRLPIRQRWTQNDLQQFSDTVQSGPVNFGFKTGTIQNKPQIF